MVVKRGFDRRATDKLKEWLLDDRHLGYPYPNEAERKQLAEQTGMSVRQILNWFVNARKRIWQPLLIELGYDVKRIVSERKQLHLPKLKTANGTMMMKQVEKLRKGHWSLEEEKYAEKLVEGFFLGVLALDKGTALRSFLASRLNCHPMRISKKFAKQAKLGKSYYSPKGVSSSFLEQLRPLEEAFYKRVEKETIVQTTALALKQNINVLKEEPVLKRLKVKEEPPLSPLPSNDLIEWTLDWDEWLFVN